jgi:hypothetical protein
LHWQSQAGPDLSAVNFMGANPLPLWAPSQNGRDAERPHVQYQ